MSEPIRRSVSRGAKVRVRKLRPSFLLSLISDTLWCISYSTAQCTGPLKLCSAAQRRGPGTSTLARRRFDAQRTVSIASFGAKGDGRSDDSGAIMRAFASACGSAKGGQRTVLLFPGGKVYMSYAALIFQGPCGNSNLLVQVRAALLMRRSSYGSQK